MNLLSRRLVNSSPFRVFRFSQFRMLWFGLTASNIGTWLRQVAVSVLIFDLTGSPFLVGLANVFGFVPILLLSLLGGRTVDRTSSRAVLIGAQLFSVVISASLALLAALDLTPLPVLFGAVFLLGSSYAFTKPAAQAFLPDLVPAHALADAVAVNGTQFTLGLAIGPALATAVIISLGMPAAFALDAATFAILLWVALRLPARQPAESGGSIASALRFISRRRILLVLLSSIAAGTVAIEVAKTLMPIFAVRSFGLDSANAGFLIAVFGGGTLVGSMIGPRLGARRGIVAAGTELLILGVSVVGFSNTDNLGVALPLLFVAGITNLASFIVLTERFFRLVPPEMRGRVFAVHALSFLGISPIAALVSGAIAEAAGPTVAGSITGGFAFVAAIILFAFRDELEQEPLKAPEMPGPSCEGHEDVRLD